MFGFWKKKKKKAKKEPTIACSKCGAENPLDAKFCLSCGANVEDQKEVQEKVKEAERITEDFKDKGGWWAKWVPGYKGYKQKEIRRESGKILRDHLVNKLNNARKSIYDMQEEAADENPSILGKLDDLVTELDTFTNKIEHADYGFGGLFDAQKFKEAQLDQLIDFDRSMVETVIELEKAIEELGKDLNEEPLAKIKEIRNFIDQSQEYYQKRDEFIQGFSPD